VHLKYPSQLPRVQLNCIIKSIPLRYIIHLANDNPRNLNRSSAAGGVSGGFKVGSSSKVSMVMARGIGELMGKEG